MYFCKKQKLMRIFTLLLLMSFSQIIKAQWIELPAPISCDIYNFNDPDTNIIKGNYTETYKIDTVAALTIKDISFIVCQSINSINQMLDVVKYCKNIESLSIGFDSYYPGSISSDLIIDLQNRFPNLKKLIVSDYDSESSSSHELILRNINDDLHEIDLILSGDLAFSINKWPTKLKSFNINEVGISSLASFYSEIDFKAEFPTDLDSLTINCTFVNDVQIPQNLKKLKFQIDEKSILNFKNMNKLNLEKLSILNINSKILFDPISAEKEYDLRSIDFSELQLDNFEVISIGKILLSEINNIDFLYLFGNLEFKNFGNKINAITIQSPLKYIDSLPESLRYLNLSDLEITQLPTLPINLEYLNLNNLPLSSLPSLPINLEYLDLNNLSISSLPTLPQNLNFLSLSYLPLSCLPTLPQNLREFYFSEIGEINCIPNETNFIKNGDRYTVCLTNEFVCDSTNRQLISGKIYFDKNFNGVIDEQDIILPNVIIRLNEYSYSKSNMDGLFNTFINEYGQYTLIPNYNHLYYKQSIPTSVIVDYQEGQAIDSVFFLIQVENKNDVQINGTHQVARPGMSTKIVSFVENLSLESKNNLTVKILKPLDWTLQDAVPTGYYVSNDTIIWNNVAIPELRNSIFSVSSTLPLTATILGDEYQYEMWVENEGDINTDNNYYRIIDTIIGSYDPNDKIVNYSSLSPDLSNTSELIYTIRFQNTGTDTAFRVVVIDTIIGNLDPTSIRVIGASHDFEWDYQNQGVATFVFDNILLPDSNVNEPKSHGFITLALRPSKDLEAGDSIYNRAGIYFDYNEAVITNTANTKIITATSSYTRNNIPLSIYPNPAKNQVRVEWNISAPTLLNLTDITGKIIQTERLTNGYTDINVSQLPKGLYIIQLQSGQDIAVSKLIVQ